MSESGAVSVKCPLCDFFVARNVKGVVRHIGAVHSHSARFHIICGVDGCPRSYHNFHSYKKHMFKKHRDIMEVSTTGRDDSATGETMDCDISADMDSDDALNESFISCADKKKHSALFLMKATAISKVSISALNTLIEDIHILLENQVEFLRDEFRSILSQRNIEFDAQMTSVFQNVSLTKPFSGLNTDHLRKDYYISEMNLLEPVERKLGERVLGNGKKQADFVYEIPLLASLKQLLSNPFVLDEVLRGHCRQDKMLADYCDGGVFQSHPLFSNSPKSLQIILYYDDVEVCNPLGSRAKKHKLALFYYTLGNISPVYRSMLKNIHLLLVMKSSVLQTYGADVVLENFMKDIKELEKDDGVTFDLGGVNHSFNGTITLIPGDNLASQYLGGYKGLSSALRKCRQCMAVDDDMQSKFVSEAFQPRTRETHEAHCSLLQGPLREHYSTTFGLNRDSIINTSRYFHITEGLIPDVMHDILEGALPLEVKEFLKYHTGKKTFSLSQLNRAMESFPYGGADSRNKPAPISSTTLGSRDHSLKQTATQMWCLARLLPLMIGEMIEEEDEHWDNLLLLLLIVDYCFAPVLSEEWAAYLRTLIRDHHEQFKKLYSNCRLTPKMHYMVHLPEIILKYGPLIRFWCMRFEGKHNYFKDLAHRIKCFKNIPKTLAYRHQEFLCYHSNSTSSPFYKDSTTGAALTRNVHSLVYKEVLLDTLVSIPNDEVTIVSSIEVNGIAYKPGDVVVVAMDLVPHFGTVLDIVVVDVDIFYFVCEVLITDCFSHHFHAFQTQKHSPPKYICIKQTDIYDHTPLTSYTISSKPYVFFVPLKYQLMEKV